MDSSALIRKMFDALHQAHPASLFGIHSTAVNSFRSTSAWTVWRLRHTVRNYLIRISDKLRISSRVELVLFSLSGAEEKSGIMA